MIVLTDRGPISIAANPASSKGFSTDSLIFRDETLYSSPFSTGIVPKLYFANGDFFKGSKLNPSSSYNLITDNGNFNISWTLENFMALDTSVKYVVTTTQYVTRIDPLSSFGSLTLAILFDYDYWENTFLSAVFGATKEVGDKLYVEIKELYLCHKFSQLFLIKGTNPNTGSEYVRYFLTFTFDPEIQSSLITKVESFGYTNVTVDYVRTDYDTIYQYYNGDLLNGNSIYVEILNPDELELSVEPKNTDVYTGDKITYNVKYIYKGNEYQGVPSVNVSATTGIILPSYFSTPSYEYTVTVSDDAPKNCFINFYDTVTNKVVSATINVINGTEQTGNNSPYLPDGGGISGGGNSSVPSTVPGTFNGSPGPEIVEKLPVGSSGSDIASSGMYTKYLCNNALLNLLAEFFWEDNVGIQALKAVLGNPIDSIISLTAYPFALDTLVHTTDTTIYFGQYDSHFSAFSLTESSFQIDWGSVTIPFFWGSFLDYSPYTKIQLYLPWGVGFVSIDPNEVVPWSGKNSYNKADFVNGTIRIVTNIELDKGACVHSIIGNNGRIIGSFGGVVGKQVPVTGSDNSARILAMISAAVSSSAAIGTSAGGTLAAGKNLAYGKGMSMAERAEGHEMIGNYKSYVGNTVQSLSNALSSPPSYPRAGTFSDATNTLGYQYPYLIISRPSQSVPQQYGRFMGYPSNIFHAHLGEVRGYTEVSSIHLENINATANELDELESILKGGVLL